MLQSTAGVNVLAATLAGGPDSTGAAVGLPGGQAPSRMRTFFTP